MPHMLEMDTLLCHKWERERAIDPDALVAASSSHLAARQLLDLPWGTETLGETHGA